jgi:uroporphyrinogen decarboxylase
MMTSKERLQRVLSGEFPDRVPFQDAYWQTTIERWRREGLPAAPAPGDYFGCEMAMVGGDYTLQFPVRPGEESDRYRIYTDADGATRKELRTGDGWTPYWLDFAIKNRADWEKLRERGAYRPSRLPGGLADSYRQARAQGRFVVFRAHACFHPTWHKIGLERMLIAMIEEPEWIVDMFAVHTRLITDLYEGLKAQGIECDAAWLSDDLGYRSAPLISPAMYRELVMPYHRQACEYFARDGLRTMLHSDGDVRPLIPAFLEAGFSCLHPLEVKAGLDVRDLKQEYGGRLVCFGNIDVRRLAGTREEIEEEVRAKVTAGKQDGGYIFHSDHSVPSDVSLDNYRFALQMLDRYGRYA